MNEDRTPILVGAAQLTQKDVDPAGATEKLLERVDCVGVVNILGHDYGNAPRAKTELYTAIGGNSPQFLLNEVSARIADGRVATPAAGSTAQPTHQPSRPGQTGNDEVIAFGAFCDCDVAHREGVSAGAMGAVGYPAASPRTTR